MTRTTTFLILTACAFACCGADDGCNTSESHDREIVNEQQKLYATTQPVPMFKWSQARDNLIQIYKLANDSRSTYAVVRASGTGEILWHCPSIGFPIPADTQLTNPLQPVYNHNGAVIEQAEPNGLFTSKNTDGTYVLCVLPDGTVSPQYSEAKVEVFTRPVKVEGGKVVWIDGAPTMTMERHKPQ